VKISILACSIGAEVYSIVWTLRSEWLDRRLAVSALDISREALEFGQAGVYPLAMGEFTDQTIFARLTDEERHGLFHDCCEQLKVREWLKAGITWRVGDATDPQLIDLLGLQDMVFANNFLCHMYPRDAEKCLRNIVTLIKPGGYLFVSGVDLNVRTKVARDLMLEPVLDFIDEIHNADPSLLRDWPFNYWGLEPMNKRKPDWEIRYSSVFRVPGAAPPAVLSSENRKPIPASAG